MPQLPNSIELTRSGGAAKELRQLNGLRDFSGVTDKICASYRPDLLKGMITRPLPVFVGLSSSGLAP